MTGSLTARFPMPDTPELQKAYRDLHLSEHGDDATRKLIGDPALLPRPWDPPTCATPGIRRELWAWLEAVVIWFNHEYVWDLNAGMIPQCWPRHPHLVHEIAVLADQRRRAAIDKTSGSMEEWHRYCVPAFLDRMKLRMRSNCDERHTNWPAEGRYTRSTSPDITAARLRFFDGDVAAIVPAPAAPEPDEVPWARPRLHLVDDDGNQIDPATGEILA